MLYGDVMCIKVKKSLLLPVIFTTLFLHACGGSSGDGTDSSIEESLITDTPVSDDTPASDDAPASDDTCLLYTSPSPRDRG